MTARLGDAISSSGRAGYIRTDVIVYNANETREAVCYRRTSLLHPISLHAPAHTIPADLGDSLEHAFCLVHFTRQIRRSPSVRVIGQHQSPMCVFELVLRQGISDSISSQVPA
jgi:hypothetical protein